MLNPIEKYVGKRRKKIFELYKNIHVNRYSDFDEFLFNLGDITGVITMGEKNRSDKLNSIKTFSFLDGVFYAIENKIISEKQFIKMMVEMKKSDADQNKGKESYTG